MLTNEQIDQIANDGCRNAIGGIYAMRVHEFARAIEQAARMEALEEAAKAVEDHNRSDREWVRGSLWDALSREAAGRIRALMEKKE